MWSTDSCQFKRRAVLKVFLACQASTLVFADCVPYPIAAKIGNVSLSNSQAARGITYSVGSPAQNFTFLPQWPLNNVMIYGINGVCKSPAPSTDVGCTTWRGGAYNKAASTSSQKAASGTYPSDGGTYPAMDFVTDTMILNDNISLSELGMGIPSADWGEEGYYRMMAVGLGPDSTLLKALDSTQKILSRTWSMFYGWTGDSPQSQLDGTFVLGGYDRAKVAGQGYTFATTANAACDSQLMVTIEDMVLTFANGTIASLFTEQSDTISACISPDFPGLMTIPLDPYFETFQTLTDTSISERSFGLEYYTVLYNAGDQPFDGDLTFHIQSGPSIRIPNNQLIVPERTVSSDTGAIQANTSAQNLILNPIQSINAHDLSRLGSQFLSSAYIMMNQDTNQFTIWQSNPTNNVDLVAVDTNGNEATNFCANGAATAAATGATTATPSQASQTSAPPDSSHSMSKKAALSSGAIAGIAIAGVAVIAIIAAAAFILYRRRGRAIAPAAAVEKDPLPGGELPLYTTATPDPNPSELSGQGDVRTEYFKPELQGTPSPSIAAGRSTQHRYELVG